MFGNWPKLTIGQIAGIPLQLDLTFVLVPIILLYVYSNWGIDTVWPVFVAGVSVIFLSVLLHELGHALAARHFQVGVLQIVIGGFFGYVNLKRQAVPRGVLISILAAGPVVNLAIFASIWLVLPLSEITRFGVNPYALTEGGLQGWILETARIFALINLLMFISNLLPIYPLDGGRIFLQVLNGFIPSQTSTLIVLASSILSGAAIFYFGQAQSTIIAIFGVYIVWVNLRSLLRHRKSRTRR